MQNKFSGNKQNKGSLCQLDDIYSPVPEQALEGKKMLVFEMDHGSRLQKSPTFSCSLQ